MWRRTPSSPFFHHLKVSRALLFPEEKGGRISQDKVCWFGRFGNIIGHSASWFFSFKSWKNLTPFSFQRKSYRELTCEVDESELFCSSPSPPPSQHGGPWDLDENHWLPGVLGCDLYINLNFFLGFPIDYWVNNWMSICSLCFPSKIETEYCFFNITIKALNIRTQTY